jgi:hypothetical protein
MVQIRRSREPLAPLGNDVQLGIAADTNGTLCIWHARNEGGNVDGGWTRLSSDVFADGDWVRVGIELDYTTSQTGIGYARVRINGSICPTDYGFRAPNNLIAGGAWHRLAVTGSGLGEIGLIGTKADDLIVTTKSYVSEDLSAGGSTGNVPNAWFDENGFPRNASLQSTVPGYTLGDVYVSGVAPYGTEPLSIKSFSVGSVPVLEFNGYKAGGSGYTILRSSTPDFKNSVELGSADGSFTGNSKDWNTRWEGKGTQPAGAFYKVIAR